MGARSFTLRIFFNDATQIFFVVVGVQLFNADIGHIPNINNFSILAASSETFQFRHAMDGRWCGLEPVNNKFNHP